MTDLFYVRPGTGRNFVLCDNREVSNGQVRAGRRTKVLDNGVMIVHSCDSQSYQILC